MASVGAEARERCAGGLGLFGLPRRIGERADRGGKAIGVVHLGGAAGREKGGIGGGGVRHVRARHDRRTVGGRFERRMPAPVDERAADEGDPGAAIPAVHFAQGVGEVDRGSGIGLRPARAGGEGKASRHGSRPRSRRAGAGGAGRG